MIIVVIFITASIGDKTVLKHNLNNFHILKKKKKTFVVERKINKNTHTNNINYNESIN